MKEILTPRFVLAVALGFSLASLAAAYGAEHLFGIKPCVLCYYQRYLHFAAVSIAILALLSQRYTIGIFAVAGTYLSTAGLAFYQVLVEQKIVPLPKVCQVPTLNYGNFEQLKQQMMHTNHITCDQIPWSLFGISLAGYSALFTLTAGAVSLLAGIIVLRKSQVNL